MYHDLAGSASFWSFLLTVDEDLAEETRKKGCPCGGSLHSANYLRKPRGTPAQLPEQERLRLSFCCDRDGCRKRAAPPSVRFLGRKVYLAAIVILVSAMRQGPSPRRVSELSQRFGADERTIARWQTFWREHFPRTAFWQIARAGFVTLGQTKSLIYSLVDTFLGRRPPREGWTLLLRFLSPITAPGGLEIKVSE
jgi:hypothetical protein